MSVSLYVHQKREAVCAIPLPVTGQGSTPLSLILLSIPYNICNCSLITSCLLTSKYTIYPEPLY